MYRWGCLCVYISSHFPIVIYTLHCLFSLVESLSLSLSTSGQPPQWKQLPWPNHAAINLDTSFHCLPLQGEAWTVANTNNPFPLHPQANAPSTTWKNTLQKNSNEGEGLERQKNLEEKRTEVLEPLPSVLSITQTSDSRAADHQIISHIPFPKFHKRRNSLRIASSYTPLITYMAKTSSQWNPNLCNLL